MAHSIEQKDLDIVINNQKECEDLAPVTSRATFRLSLLKEFIDKIEKCPGFQADNAYLHNIAITFVREDLNRKKLGYKEEYNPLENHSQIKGANTYSQLMPIITGCIAKLDDGFITVEYADLEDKSKKIPFLRSGGEGTGLIPPPPRVK